MTHLASDREIHLVQRHVPGAEVLGVTREGKGLLLHVPGHATAAETQEREAQLLRAGVREWNWTAESGGMRVRAYWRDKGSQWWRVALAAAVFAAAYVVRYDVHLTQAAAGWLAQVQRSSGLSI